MEPTLMVIGLNYCTAPVEVRERFWISPNCRAEVALQLVKAEGIDEAIVLCTCNRTEFYLWTSDVTLAANSVMRLLAAGYGLKLCEWKYFYRLLDEAALLHIFRVASCIDSWLVGAPQIVPRVLEAWQQAQKAGTSGRMLDAVLQKAFTVSERVRRETGIGTVSVSIPSTAVEFARQIFGTLKNKKILLIGAGEMSELSAQILCSEGLLHRDLLSRDGGSLQVGVINRTFEHAAELAVKLGGTALPFEERWRHMAEADIIISATSCPHTILSREEVEAIVAERNRGAHANQPLVLVDLALPRDIDPAVRKVEGVFLCDLDDLENVPDPTSDQREAAAAAAQKIVQVEARGFRQELMAERVVPATASLRMRLEEICRQEFESFRAESGPFSKEQDEMLNTLMSRTTQRIAASLARELRELPEQVGQEQMPTALQALFHLPTAERASASTRH